MRICLVADGRTPTPKIWIRYLRQKGHEIHLISTYPCNATDPPVDSLHVVPLDFSARARALDITTSKSGLTSHGNPVISRLRGGRAWKALVSLRDRLMPQAISIQKRRVRQLIAKIQPDLVHAMRIPFEGILAAEALMGESYPLLISVWGNDFTLYAAGSATTAHLTRRAMQRTNALHPDCERDLHLASQYGFGTEKPALVVPGYGGVPTETFFPGPPDHALAAHWGIPLGSPIVINPRGVKPYIRTEAFLRAIPLVLAQRPDVIFLGGMMQGNAFAEGLIADLGLEQNIRTLPLIPHNEMAALFRMATVTVSPADHDGTPNSLLEAMACGVFPVAGNIDSVREWLQDGVNSLLCDQKDPISLATAILNAIKNDKLRDAAREINYKLIKERADFHKNMANVDHFYHGLITGRIAART